LFSKRRLINIGIAVFLVVFVGAAVASIIGYPLLRERNAKARFADRNEQVAAQETSSGSIGRVDLFDLRINDCTETPEPNWNGLFERARRVSCDDQWDLKVTRQFLTALPEDSLYPGYEYYSVVAETECPWEGRQIFFPSRDSWRLGDRVWLCLETNGETA